MSQEKFVPTVKIIADSINPDGQRITTIVAKYHRFIHAEMLTYRRDFSRNASSSRAIPIPQMIKNLREDNVFPLYWGKHKSGMSADKECSNLVRHPRTGEMISREEAWFGAREDSIAWAEAFADAGYHKQIVNRIVEPYSAITVIITATRWDQLFSQRIHPAAQPEIRVLAEKIRDAINENLPYPLEWGEWHIPFISPEDVQEVGGKEGDGLIDLIKISTGRDARVSYLTHEGMRDLQKDIDLHDKLVSENPPHHSPLEHVAKAKSGRWANFDGFCSYRYHDERKIPISSNP